MLFSRQGFEATTTLEIARQAEIGVGTLFSYVTSKEDLLILTFTDDLLIATGKARQEASKAKSLLSKISTVYAGLLAYHYARVDTSLRLLREVAFVRNPARRVDTERLMGAVNDAVADFIKSELATTGFQLEGDVETLTENCFAIYYHSLVLSLNRGDSYKKAAQLLSKHLKMQLLVISKIDR
jgi:AcrR family transcriptional regulator